MRPTRTLEDTTKYDNIGLFKTLKLISALKKNKFKIESSGHVFPSKMPDDYHRTNVGVPAPVGFLGLGYFHIQFTNIRQLEPYIGKLRSICNHI